MLPGEVAATAASSLTVEEPPGSGLRTRFHAVPFQCRTRVWSVVPWKYSPTAQALLAEVAATPSRTLKVEEPPGSGLRTCFHAVPFQRRMMVWTTPAAPLE